MIRRCVNLMGMLSAILGLGACAILPSLHHSPKPGAAATGTPLPHPSPSSSPRSLWPPWKILQRKRLPPPPKAAPLSEVGTIRIVSGDGSYAIVELAPGTLVRTGDTLLVTSQTHPVSRLKVAEVQPPCFAAEIVEGSVFSGDTVKR